MAEPKYAYVYAQRIIQGRFMEAEPHIMTDLYWWVQYESRFDIYE